MSLHKEYWDINGHLVRCSISFNKQQINWATSEPMKIGYRVSCTPIKRKELGNGMYMEEFEAFSGFGDSLFEVDRQSSKRLEAAIKQLATNKEKYTEWFKQKYNW